MAEAANGSKEQANVFAHLGVSATDMAGQLRPTEDVLLDLADAFAAMPDGAEKSALAVKFFGKSGIELIPFLNQGLAGIEELKQKFKELGLEISGDTAMSAEKFNDTLDTVKQALTGIATKVAEATLPALQRLADALMALASKGDAIMTVLHLLGEAMVTVLAVRGVAAVAALGGALTALKAAFMRFLPVLAVVGAWEMGRGIVNMVQDIRETNRAIDEMNRRTQQLEQLNAAMRELANTGTLSVKTQMMLAAQAAERLKSALPGTADALRSIQGAATQVGEAIRQALDAETKKAAEAVKQLLASYKQVAADIKAIWDARINEVESHYKRQEAAAQSASRSEAAAIRESVQAMLAAEREKLAAVEAGARQMESAWRATYGQAVALARAAGQDVQAIERQAVEARMAIYSQMESAYRATIDRLMAEEQRHLQATKAADEARLNMRLSVEDRIRELARKGMDEYAAYQDRLRQIDEKQAQARAALAAGNYEQARKIAEEAIALAERTASVVTRQVEYNGKTITQTLVSEGQAAKTAIGEIKEAASIADAAMKAMGDAHRQAASAAGEGANEAKRALATVSDELTKLRSQLLEQDRLKLRIDINDAMEGIEKIKALTEAQQLVAKIQADTSAAQSSLEKLKSDAGNLQLLAKVEANTSQVMADIDRLKGLLASTKVEIPALVSFDQPRQQLASFAVDAKTVLSAPTAATHTVHPDLNQYREAISELLRPTSSTHTIYVQKVYTNALGGLIEHFAEGGSVFRRMTGRIVGPGTETSDSIPALLSHGEFVIRASSVRKFGAGFFAALNAGFMPAVPQRFASGGFLGDAGRDVFSNLPDYLAIGPRNTSSPLHVTVQMPRDYVRVEASIEGRHATLFGARDQVNAFAKALRELSRGA